MKHRGLLVFGVGLLISLVSCQTVPTEIPEDLSQAELIQLAQEAADQDNSEAAIAYYQAIRDRYPQDRASVATASYEIAFIQYKQGDLEEARAGFEELLGLYDFEAESLPAWPGILAQKLLDEMDEAAGTPTAEE